MGFNSAFKGLTGTYGNLISYFLNKCISQTVYAVCTRINHKILPVTNLKKIYICTMVQVELNNMYIIIGANNGSEKL